MKKVTALIASAAVALGLTAGGLVAAAPASAHTPNVKVDCSTVTVDLTNYAAPKDAVYKDVKVVDSAEVKEVSHVKHQLVSEAVPAVYADVKVIDKAAVPAVPAVTHTEYEFKQFLTGKTRWETNPNWNANGNPNSIGWFSTGKTQVITDKAAIPAQPEVSHIEHQLVTAAKDAVYKDVKVIDVAYAAEVSHIEKQLVSDAKANHITVAIAGKTVEDKDFGTSYHNVFTFDNKYIANDYSVKVTAWDNSAYNVNESGTSTPCAVPVVDAKTAAVLTASCGFADLQVTNPEAEYTDNKTGAVTVWIDGKFKEAISVAGNATENRHYDFAEDSGDHEIVVKNAEFAGGAVLAQVTVHSDCIAPQPEAKVTYGDWETGKYGCGDTTVTMTRTVTVTPYILVEGEWVLDTENAETASQTETRNLTGAEIEALDCPVVVVPPVTPPTTPPTTSTPAPKPPVKAAAVAPTKTFVTDTSDTLAQTGTNEDFGGIGAIAGIVIVLGLLAAVGAGINSRRKAARK